jgi:23S rRNA pseudouridine1911/1915/1917 synthase
MQIDGMEDRHIVQYRISEEEQGLLLREYLLKHRRISRKSLSAIKHAGDIRINGERVTVRAVVKDGDLIEVTFPREEESPYLVPQKLPLDILFEDEDILLINKQAGVCVHPTFSQKSGTLANGVMYHWKEQGKQRTFHAVNRIDKDTSGIVLLAQHRLSHQQLSIQQKSNQLERRYYALVHGVIQQDSGVIEAPIGRNPHSIIEREVRDDGQYAKTTFRVCKRYSDYTWVEVKLETGRTHQIRVHFGHIGHPLLGDTLYGGRPERIARQALHAYFTKFIHPTKGEEVIFSAPVPEDLLKLTIS